MNRCLQSGGFSFHPCLSPALQLVMKHVNLLASFESPSPLNAIAQAVRLRAASQPGHAAVGVLLGLALSSFAQAGTGSCAGTGIIEIDSPVAGSCRLETGDTLLIRAPSGEITDFGTAVGVVSGQDAVRIENAGLIRADSFGGIDVIGSVGVIDNQGTIEGEEAIYNLGTIGEINNAATGVLRSITGGYAIYSEGALTEINNRGLIDGNVETTGTTLNLLGTQASIDGNVVNTGGSVNVRSGAVFVSRGTFSSATFLIESGGEMRIGSNGYGITVTSPVGDAFNNAGTLHVPDGIEGQITGNYTQSGTLRVGASSAASFGRLTVTGDVTLTPGARFDVDVSGVNTLAAGDTLSGVVVASGDLDNQASPGNVTDNSALFNFRVETSENQIDLQVLAAGTASPSQPGRVPTPGVPAAGQGIVPATIQAGLVNGVSAAQVLDGYIRGGRTGTDWDAVVTALGQLPDDASVARAVGQAMPSMHGSASRSLMAHASSTGSAIVEQLAWSGMASGEAMPGTGLWVKPLSTWADQDRYRQISGYRVRSQGLVGGYQTSFGPGSSVGFGFAYLDGRVDGRDFALGQRSDLESVQVLGYGSYDLSGWRLQWQADATRSSVKSVRRLGFIGRSAQASYRGNTWHLGLNFGRPMDMAGTTVTPSVGIDWRRMRSSGYTETGAGALNLRVAAQTAEELIVKLGVEARHPLGARTHLLGQAAVGYDLASGRDVTTAQFTGGGAVFATQGLARRRALAELGVGLLHRASETIEVSVRYALTVREGMTDQGASLRLDWRF